MAAIPKAPVADNRRVLIIDDNLKIHADFRKILGGASAKARHRRNALEALESAIVGKLTEPSVSPKPIAQGFELDFAERGQDGLEMLTAALAQDRPYALAFVDMRMPNGWDGVETIRQLWKADPRLQVVICTAYSEHSWQEIVALFGNRDSLLFLKKPFDDVEICQLACALTRKWNAVEAAARQLLELRNSEAEARKLAMVVSRTHHAVIVTDAKGLTQWVNDGFVRHTGYTLDEVTGRTPGSVLQGAETDAATITTMRQALARGEGFNVEILNYRKDGSRYWHIIDVKPVYDEDGKLKNYVGIQTDTTQQRQIAQELAHAKEVAESANRAKGEFLASISHEIRTPMTAIIGYAELMIRSGPNEATRREWAIQTQRNADYLLALLNDILDFSKIEAGRLRIVRQPCRLVEVVKAVHSLLKSQATEKGIKLTLAFATPVPQVIATDPVRLRQILTNMLSNAIKFTDDGAVELQVRCDRGQEKPTIEFAVVDTGIGIAPDRLARLFTPFTQVHDRNRTRQTSGSGLGLAISQELARLLGGRIDVTSELGRGSNFSLRLPLSAGDLAEPVLDIAVANDAANRVEPHRVSAAPHLPQRRLLVVDDNPDNRFIIEVLLAETGAHVVLADNGQKCLEQVHAAELSGQPFELILLDMNMPVMDGYQAAAELRSAGCAVPIIALTAYALADDERKCLAAGCDGYLSKPIRPNELYETIATHLNNPPPRAAGGNPPVPPATSPRLAGAAAVNLNVFDLRSSPSLAALAREYAAALPERITEIQTAWRDQDLRRTRTLVHRLHGTGASLGFAAITQAAGECERALDSGQLTAAVEEQIRKLLGVLQASAKT